MTSQPEATPHQLIELPGSRDIALRLTQAMISEKIIYFNKIYENALIATSWDRLNRYQSHLNATTQELEQMVWLIRQLETDEEGSRAVAELAEIIEQMRKRWQFVWGKCNQKDKTA